MRKESSTNSINKKYLEATCGIAYTHSMLNGRWKLSILAFLLYEKKLRYSELKNVLEGISEKVLIEQLKELQADGLVLRIAYPEVPPRVEYELSNKGKSLEKVLVQMAEWGTINIARNEN
jgi:DNA-binding HxlR family transcriptional regulator